MSIFKSENDSLKVVTKLSVFPKIGSVVLRKKDKLIVFNPSYLLGKHGQTSKEIASKFLNLKNALQLMKVIDENISYSKLSGSKVEIKNVDFGSYVGIDSLVEIPKKLGSILPVENVRGNDINIIYTIKDKIPKTKLLNIILVLFNPQYGQGVNDLFKQKYSWVGFENFKSVYAVLTIFPGKYAPPMNVSSFWNKHALLKEI
ncbi:MAG: hypothetical protein ACMXX5_02085 [Candidatus Woesearchaeota archaeon]